VTEAGDCYEAAVHFMWAAIEQGKAEGLTVCHGEVEGQGALRGQRFGHAWCERDLPGVDIVTDASNSRMVAMIRPEYYRLGRIDPDKVKRYTAKEVNEKLVEYEHFGPWE